ncbi:hypothetical protein AgCh_005955 [Apium graveolens]
MEAEYIDASEATNEAVWMRKFITGLGVVPPIADPIDLYCDNNEAIAQAKEARVKQYNKGSFGSRCGIRLESRIGLECMVGEDERSHHHGGGGGVAMAAKYEEGKGRFMDGKRFNGGSHIRFKANLSTKFSDYKIMLKICEIVRATIRI